MEKDTIQRIESLLRMRSVRLRTRNELEERKASFGMHAPTSLTHEIGYELSEIEKIDSELRRLGYSFPEVSEFEHEYCSFVASALSSIGLPGIVAAKTVPSQLDLEQVYVELDAQLASAAFPVVAGSTDSLASLSLIPEFTEFVQVPLSRALSSSNGLVVLGEAGTGKTTFLRYVGHLLATNKSGHISLGLPDWYLPILVSSNALAEVLASHPDLSLVEALAGCFRISFGADERLTECFLAAFRLGKALVLVDGLDEVSDLGQRSNLVQRLRAFYHRSSQSGNRFVVTCRATIYQELPVQFIGMQHYVVRELDADKIRSLVSTWLRLSAGARLEKGPLSEEIDERTLQFLVNLGKSPSIARAASNPLLLTMLLLVRGDDLSGPIRRIELLDEFLQTVASTWSLTRSVSESLPITMETALVVQSLAPLALTTIQQPNRQAGQKTVVRLIAKYYRQRDNLSKEQALRLAHDFLEKQKTTSPLLIRSDFGKYKFAHAIFEEYLAAKELVISSPNGPSFIDSIMSRLDKPEWSNVLSLAIASLAIDEEDDELVEATIERLVNCSEPERRAFALLTLARSALELGKEYFSSDRWTQILELLISAAEEPSFQLDVRVAIGEILGWLGDPRVERPEPEMVYISGGKFVLGSSEPQIEIAKSIVREVYALEPETIQIVEQILDTEIPPHEVELGSYWISKYPITNAQYRVFLEEAGYHPPNRTEEWAKPYNWHGIQYPIGKANHPVVMVSWYDANEFCAWLSRKTGITFRLPTEAEWVLAAGGPQGLNYPWGSTWITGMANALEERERLIPAKTEWSKEGYHPGRLLEDANEDRLQSLLSAGSSPVGVYSSGNSPFGVADMGGNCWEWVEDWFERYPGSKQEFGRFGRQFKVVKGSAWSSHYVYCRCNYRGSYDPEHALFEDGFRVAASSMEGRHSQATRI